MLLNTLFFSDLLNNNFKKVHLQIFLDGTPVKRAKICNVITVSGSRFLCFLKLLSDSCLEKSI